MRLPIMLAAPLPVIAVFIAGALFIFAAGGQETGEADKGFSRPAISPDGKRLALEFRGAIWVAPLEGGEAVPLATDSMRRHSPVWSPDGRQIACVATDPTIRVFSIQLLDAEGNAAPRSLWQGVREICGTIDWSPDGQQLAIVIGPEEGISLLPAEGGAPTPLGFSGMHPRFSPDGKLLACQRAANLDLWIISLSDGQEHRLHTDVAVKSSFAWSPDASEIVYESLDRESLDLWKVAAKGGRAVPLTNDIAIEQGPRWHPTDGKIYFSHRRRIWSIGSTDASMEAVAIRCRIPAAPGSPPLAIEGVSVVDVTAGEVTTGQTLLLREGVIQEAGPGVSIPADARLIDGTGLFAVPGLIDMHVHYEPYMGEFFLRYGVTRVLEMGCGEGLDYILSLGDEIAAAQARGPLLHQSGSVINGSGIPGPPGLGGIQSASPDVIRKAVEWHLQEGVDIVKIGSENTHATLRAILDVAHANHRRVMGHIALVPALEAIEMGQDGIEHPRGLGWAGVPPMQRPQPIPRGLPGMLREAAAWRDTDSRLVDEVVERMVRNGVVWDPTLAIWVLGSHPDGILSEPEFGSLPPWVQERFRRERKSGFLGTWNRSDFEAYGAGIPAMRDMVGRFYRAGGMLTAGSDGGIPGLALHRELGQLELSGLTPLDCLRAATLNAAKVLGKETEIGSIQPGKQADLILVTGNPLENLSNLKEVALTIQQGRVVYQRESRR